MRRGPMLSPDARARRATGAPARTHCLAERGAALLTSGQSRQDAAAGRRRARATRRPPTTLDGIEPGLWSLRRLERRGVTVLNPPDALVAMHDKLETALRLRAVNLPHPRTAFLPAGASPSGIELPVVIKPRFGSWGRHVHLCTTKRSLRRCLQELRGERWFQEQGAIAQELVEPVGRDLRVLVAAGEVVGAISRVAADGEWRTNVALGGTRHPAMPGRRARSLALAAAAAVGADLVGVDLLPRGRCVTSCWS